MQLLTPTAGLSAGTGPCAVPHFTYEWRYERYEHEPADDAARIADREVPHRAGGQAPRVPVPRRHLRRGSGVREHRGMVRVDSARDPAEQGPAVLSPARRERRIDLHRLRLRA